MVSEGSKRLGLVWLLLITSGSLVFLSATLEAFERYDHFLNSIAFRLMSASPFVPRDITHNAVMAIGFALVGLLLALVPAALGLRRGWIAIGSILTVLNLAWYYSVELQVAGDLGRTLAQSLDVSIAVSYLINGLGSFGGAYGCEKLFALARRQSTG